MTTVAMVAGMLPIALSLSGDASWRAPMGVTVIGGLIFSTILTLLLVPAYFSIAISIESRIGRLFHRVVGSDAHRRGTLYRRSEARREPSAGSAIEPA